MLRALLQRPSARALTPRFFSSTPSALAGPKPMPQRPAPLPEEDFTEAFLCGTGPGGQKINKTSSAVQLRHTATGIVLKVQATRSRSQNRKIARQMLAERVELETRGKESRAAVVAEVKRKRKGSSNKKSRRKYRSLEEEKEGEEAGRDGEGAEEGAEKGS